MIDKDTTICCSFSKKAGNFGCTFFNKAFREIGLNWIYKSFSVGDIGGAVEAMRTLGFRGAGVSMPFKREVIKYLDGLAPEVHHTRAVNTIVNDGGRLTGFNTDYLAAQAILRGRLATSVVILGDGGYAQAVKYACKQLGLNWCSITRADWYAIKDLRGGLVYNCTPVENLCEILHPSCDFVDCIIGTQTGDDLAVIQARHQFYLYTGRPYDAE